MDVYTAHRTVPNGTRGCRIHNNERQSKCYSENRILTSWHLVDIRASLWMYMSCTGRSPSQQNTCLLFTSYYLAIAVEMMATILSALAFDLRSKSET